MLGLFQRQVTEEDLLDLHGKIAIVTGANTGIGYATVQFLARKGAKVYIAARDEGRVAEAIEKLKLENIENGAVHWLKLDLSDPRNSRLAADEFLRNESRLDILINNAALGAFGSYELNKDGLLDIMVINHVSHFAFTEALLPLLKQTALEPDSDVRIINVTSIAHARLDLETFDKATLNREFGPSVGEHLDTYGNSKLANILHIKELQRRLDDENIPILCLAVHPGPVRTIGAGNFVKSVPYLGAILHQFFYPFYFGAWRNGAMPISFAAASKVIHEDRAKYKAGYIMPVAQLSQPSKSAQNPKLAKELWETTEAVLKELK